MSVAGGALRRALVGAFAVMALLVGPSGPAAIAGELDVAEVADGHVEVRDAADGQAEEEERFPPVEVLQPRLLLTGLIGSATFSRVIANPEVVYATSIRIGEMDLSTPSGEDTVTVASVDPDRFRLLAPQVTADAAAVWERIVEGDGAFLHEVGHRLELELGERVPVLSADDESLRVGALASNGIPPVADVIVSRETARRLGLEGRRSVLVALDPDADVTRVATILEAATGLVAEVFPEPLTRQASLRSTEAPDVIEPFTYVSIGDGMIQIDPAWVNRNIVDADVPVFRGKVRCHRVMIPQLRGALQEVVDRGLDHLIDPSQYGGCWVPRHILFNPNRALSMHAWGLAIDFNVSTNQFGAVPQLDRRIVEIFERWGFEWGGHWSTPDGMHFELRALLTEA